MVVVDWGVEAGLLVDVTTGGGEERLFAVVLMPAVAELVEGVVTVLIKSAVVELVEGAVGRLVFDTGVN